MARRSVCIRLEDATTKATSSREVKDQIKGFLETVEGNSLRTWLRFFDTNRDNKISFGEFHMGMLRLNFTGDTRSIFSFLDNDGSGEISLEEIDNASARVWVLFRKWCVATFKSGKDFLQQLSSGNRKPVDMEAFTHGIKVLGWTEGFEEILYKSIDMDNTGHISHENIAFLETDMKRQKRKNAAKAKAQKLNARKLQERRAADAALLDFRRYLLQKFGSFTRAWRRGIDTDGSMVVQKHEAVKACQELGWHGNVRCLWKALDKDEGGVTLFEELDGPSAEQLAQFQCFCVRKFGNIKAAFRAFDKNNTHRLKKNEFLTAISEAGFTRSRKGLFEALDFQGNGSLIYEDLCFLESWRPSAYLSSDENPAAMNEFKQALLKHFQHYLKAWRHMDKDGSNRCSWPEFERVCKLINFKGDQAGAWRALDADLSGFISLQELDKTALVVIMEFKDWADEEFGGIRAAFGVFDSDHSGDLNYSEFRRCCRAYGYNGDCKKLFLALDYNNSCTLELKDVAFIDTWESPEKTAEMAAAVAADNVKQQNNIRPDKDPGTVRFATEAPAPGAYEIPSGIGAARSTPATRYNGSPRWPTQELSPDKNVRDKRTRLPPLQEGVSPQQYDVMTGLQQASWVRQKPSFSFGRSSRPSNETTPRGRPTVPGPGDYAPMPPSTTAPKYAFTSRRPVVMHPLTRGDC